MKHVYEHMVEAYSGNFTAGDAVQIKDGIVHAGPGCVDEPGKTRVVVFMTYRTGYDGVIPVIPPKDTLWPIGGQDDAGGALRADFPSEALGLGLPSGPGPSLAGLRPIGLPYGLLWMVQAVQSGFTSRSNRSLRLDHTRTCNMASSRRLNKTVQTFQLLP